MEFKKFDLKLTARKVEELNPNEDKSKFKYLVGDEWKAFLENVKRKGVLVPILIRKNGDVIDGRNRLKAAIYHGFEFIPCLEVKDNLTSVQEQELVDEINNARRHMTDSDRKQYIKDKFWDLIKTKRHKSDGANFNVYVYIASKTGIPEGTVRRLVTDLRKDEEARKIAKGEIKISDDRIKAGYREFIRLQQREKEYSQIQAEMNKQKLRVEEYAPVKFFKLYQKNQQKVK